MTRTPPQRTATGSAVLNLRYRSVGSFLIAYSSRLSRGELFVETPSPWTLGVRVLVRLHVPGIAPLEVRGAVTWTRPAAIGPGQPAGMGLALSTSVEIYGAVIDELAAKYSGTRILLGVADPTSRAVTSRYLHSVLTCELLEADFFATPPATSAFDLAVVDLDSTGTAGQAFVRSMKDERETAEIPVIVLAQTERDRARSAAIGVDEVLPNPPTYADIHSAVVHVLSRAIIAANA